MEDKCTLCGAGAAIPGDGRCEECREDDRAARLRLTLSGDEDQPCPHDNVACEDAGYYDQQGIRQTVDVCHNCGAIIREEI